MRIILGITLTVFMISSVFAAVPTKKVELIFQRSYSNPIEDVLLTSMLTTESKANELGYINKKKTDNKIRIYYPKLIVTNQSLILSDENLVQKELKFNRNNSEYSIVSPNRKKFAIYKAFIQNNKNPQGKAGSKLEVYDLNSSKIIDKAFEEPRNIVLSDNGSFAIFNIYEDYGSTIDFFDDKGNLVEQVKPLKGGYSYYNGRYSNLGDCFIGVFNAQGGGGVIILFDNKGNQIWKKDLKLNQFNIYQLIISEKGNYIYMAGMSFENESYKYFNYCFDIKGNTVFFKDNGKIGTFSENEQYLYLSSENEIELMEIKTNTSIWSYSDPDSSSSITSVTFLNNGKYSIFSMRKNPQTDKKKVIILDKHGKIFSEMNVVSDKKIKKLIVGSCGEDSFYIINGNQLEMYKLISE